MKSSEKKYQGRRGEGLLEFLKKSKKIINNGGVVEIWPQVTRVKGPMGEPGKENIAMQALLKLTQDENPYVVPVGMWVKDKNPEDVYDLNFYGYTLKYGEPISAAEIQKLLIEQKIKNAEDFEGADKIVYGLIRAQLPRNYRKE